MLQADIPLALTFDDVLLVPRASSVLPAEVAIATKLGGVTLQIPLLSSAMDTVTEGRLAAAIASHGGPRRRAQELARGAAGGRGRLREGS